MNDNRTLGELILDVMEERIGEIFTCLPGKVVSWNSSIETATIQPLVKDPEGNTLPNLRGVKVCFPGVYWDLQAGETGVVVFSMLDFDTWWRTGQIDEPANLDTHDYDTGIFIPGMKRKAQSRNVPTGATVLAGNDVRLGTDSASENVIRGDQFTNRLNDFLTSLNTWIIAVSAQMTIAGGNLVADLATMQAAIASFQANLNSTLSTKVKVD